MSFWHSKGMLLKFFSYFSTQVVLTAKSNEITNIDKTILDICRDK